MRAFFTIITLTLMLFTLIIVMTKPEIFIVDTPIKFTQKRINLMKDYAQQHYGLSLNNIIIDPKIIVIHWSELNNLKKTFDIFNPETIPNNWGKVTANGQANVSVHFLVDRNGHIYRLMPETQMARHVIGLNYTAIGIENIGGEPIDGKAQANLTAAQLNANIQLVRYLKEKYEKINYLIGHYEYQRFEKHPLWLEKNPAYRTQKDDPNPEFIAQIYAATKSLSLLRAP